MADPQLSREIDWSGFDTRLAQMQEGDPDLLDRAYYASKSHSAFIRETNTPDELLATGSGMLQGFTDIMKYPSLGVNWALSGLMSDETEDKNYEAISNYYDNVGPQGFQDARNRYRKDYAANHLLGEVSLGAFLGGGGLAVASTKGLTGKALDQVNKSNNAIMRSNIYKPIAYSSIQETGERIVDPFLSSDNVNAPLAGSQQAPQQTSQQTSQQDEEMYRRNMKQRQDMQNAYDYAQYRRRMDMGE